MHLHTYIPHTLTYTLTHTPTHTHTHIHTQKFIRATRLQRGANCRDILPSIWAIEPLVKKTFHFATSMEKLWYSLPDHERPCVSQILPQKLFLGCGGNGITFEHTLMDHKYAVKWVSLKYLHFYLHGKETIYI